MQSAVRGTKTVGIESSARYSNPCSPEPLEEEGLSLETGLSEMQECASPNPMITPTPAKFLSAEADLETESGSSAKRQLVFSAEAQTQWEGGTSVQSGLEPATILSFSEVGVALADELDLADVDSIARDGADEDLVEGGELAMNHCNKESAQREHFFKTVAARKETEKAAEDSVERSEGVDGAKREGANVKGTELPEGDLEAEADRKQADAPVDVALEGAFARSSDAPFAQSSISKFPASAVTSANPNKPRRSVANVMGASTTSSQARKKPRPDDGVEGDSARSPTKVAIDEESITSPGKANRSRSAIKSPIKSKLGSSFT